MNPATGLAAAPGVVGELVVTNLGRLASPVIRYCTGDLVMRADAACPCGREFTRLEGGVLARTDDMVNVRGVNVYPAAIESIVRELPLVEEFRATVARDGAMQSLSLEIELAASGPEAEAAVSHLSQQLRRALGLTVPVSIVEPGTLRGST